MTTGIGDVVRLHGKIYAHYISAEEISHIGQSLVAFIYYNQSLEAVWERLKLLPMIGPFIAYEIACDLRFTPLLSGATDINTWANLGPGAVRGLKRLGMKPTVQSMVELYGLAINEEMVGHHVFPHNDGDPPFELREIEHSLCEFDKYQRVKTGVGRPRERYDG